MLNLTFLIFIKTIMPYNEKLADRVREALADLPDVEEKKMFRGVCFMVDGKMCICVSSDELMCRVGPDLHEVALEKNGTRAMVMKGKVLIDYVYVSEEAVRSNIEFDYWVAHCLTFNKFAKASKPKHKK
jgi:TfoX/Sxy family transcriptional regulator of competence genes